MLNSAARVQPNKTGISEILSSWSEQLGHESVRISETIPLRVRKPFRSALAARVSQPYALKFLAPDTLTRLADEIDRSIETLCQIERMDAAQFHHAETQRKLIETLSATMAALAAKMELTDPYTADHGRRVAEISCAIAREMGWPEYRIHALRMAATFHDIGKIAVPLEILNKSGPMRESELMLIKEHVQVGYEILKQIPFTWPMATIVRQHHERRDGSGYPFGLKGDEILPEARVLAVSDTIDAISFARPYRSALGPNAALAFIEKQAGTLLDVEVVGACLSLFRVKRHVSPGFKPGSSLRQAAQPALRRR